MPVGQHASEGQLGAQADDAVAALLAPCHSTLRSQLPQAYRFQSLEHMIQAARPPAMSAPIKAQNRLEH